MFRSLLMFEVLTICLQFINSLLVLFLVQYMKSRPSLKCRGMQPKLAVVSESPVTDLGGARSELRSTDSVSEA